MNKILLLTNPSFLHMCKSGAKSLAINEAKLTMNRICNEEQFTVEEVAIANVEYLEISRESDFTEENLVELSKLSFVFAMYSYDGVGLFPKEITRFSKINDSISSMMKYQGKTNELFTRCMLHIAEISNESKAQGNLRIFDPVAGKGTTLFEGMIKGFDVYGMEVGEKVVGEAVTYLKKYLQELRFKFDYQIRRANSKEHVVHQMIYAETKEGVKENPNTFEMAIGNSKFADKFYKPEFFNIVIGDLPYGVLHGNVTNQAQKSFTRNPTELLEMCLPTWKKLLKTGGVLALSWNTFVFTRKKMIEVLENFGLTVVKSDEYESLSHRVDQAIMRDIIIARK